MTKESERSMSENLCNERWFEHNEDFGLSPAQFHSGLSLLWDALGPPAEKDQGLDVFTLAAACIRDGAYCRDLAATAIERCSKAVGPCWCGQHIDYTSTCDTLDPNIFGSFSEDA